MPGCDFTRRDFLRWTGVAAASPFFAQRLLLNGVAGAPRPATTDLAGQPRARHADRGPGDHHLVHGLHRHRRRARPHGARAGRRRRALGHEPEPAEPRRRQPAADTPYHYVELDGPRAGPDLLLPSALEREAGAADAVHAHRRQRGRHRRTSASRPAARTASPRRSRRPAASCSRSRCATTCTWARRPPACRRHPGHHGHPAGARPAAVPRGDARVARRGRERPRRAVPARRGRHHGRGRARRPEPGRSAAAPVRRVPQRVLRHPRQPRPRARRRAVLDVPRRAVAGQRLLPRPVLPRRRADVLHAATSRACACSGSTPTTSRATAATPARCSTDQFGWFRAELARHRDQPTIVFGHHPLIVAELPVPDHGEQHARRRRRPRRSSPTTRACPACSCTTPGTRTATSARSARSRRASRCRRSPRARSTPAASRCCACTPAGSR